jgi:hypothetical protein
MEIYVAREGNRLGPFSEEEVRRQIAAGTLLSTDLAWTEGLASWVPLGSLPGLTVTPGGAPLPAPPPPVHIYAAGGPPYFGPPQTSGAAVTSLIAGIFSLVLCCVPVFPAIVAIVCGHTARSSIRHSGGRLTGDGMAIAGLAMGYFHFAFLTLAIVSGVFQSRVNQAKSILHAKAIVTASKAYAQDHQGAFPATLNQLVPKYLPDRGTLVDPFSPDKPVGYDYFGGTIGDPPQKVLLMSKYKEDGSGKRIVAHVDGSCALEDPPPDLSPQDSQ